MHVRNATVLFRALPAELQFSAEEKRSLRTFANLLSDRVVNRRSFLCVISDDRELRRLNHSYLGHNYPTDVLSFPSHDNLGELGEMIISAERAEAQAVEFGHDRIDELRILMLHGVLHLSGMDHERDGGRMEAAEEKWRDEFGLPLNLIARATDSRPRR